MHTSFYTKVKLYLLKFSGEYMYVSSVATNDRFVNEWEGFVNEKIVRRKYRFSFGECSAANVRQLIKSLFLGWLKKD
jgi:hypothetical protein